MNKAKKICVIILKIALIVFLIVSFNLLMMPKYINENQDGRVIPEMYKEKISPDVVFVGSSTVYSGVSPVYMYEEYGLTSYVCSTSSQTSWNSYYLLKEALNEFDPSLVVFDIGFLTESEDYVEEVSNRKAYDYMPFSVNKMEALKQTMDASESKWSYIFPVLRYHERYKDLSSDDVKYMYHKPLVTYNGFIMNKATSPDIYAPENEWSSEDTSLNEVNRYYLQEVIDLCNKENIELLLIKTPSYQAKWGPVFEEDIKSAAEENGLAYINFDERAQMMGIDYMYDSPDNGRHLNLYGAEKYSFWLGSIISNEYNIPDRRDDLAYSKYWDEKVKRYESDKAK